MYIMYLKEKILFLMSLINILFIYLNLRKYYNLKNIILSNYKISDQKNVALYTLPYEKITDYFNNENNYNNHLIQQKNIIYYSNISVNSTFKKIKIGYIDWDNKRASIYINYLKENLKDKYIFEVDKDNPDYLLFSLYGNGHNNPKFNNSIKIGIYEECYFPSFNEEDYVIGVSHIFYLDRYFIKPSLFEYLKDLKNKDFSTIRLNIARNKEMKKFCGTILNSVKNKVSFENKFIQELSKYKQVEIGNNINPIQFLREYKFSIVFEKTSCDGYSNNHLINSFMAGTIPIYYGDYLIDEYINPETYILIRNDLDLNEKIEYIKLIDQNDNLYYEFFKKNILKDENIVEKKKLDEIEYWNHIFKPDKLDAKRIDNNIYKTKKCFEKKY